MALSDIIAAIKAQADKEIAQLQESQIREKDALRHKADEAIAAYEEQMKKRKEERMQQLKKKAETMIQMARRSELLRKKRSLIDDVFEEALQEVKKLPEAKVKDLLNHLLESVQGEKGVIHPAKVHAKVIPSLPGFDKKRFTLGKENDKAGGFVFESDISEEDFSFDRLISDHLRPQTEMVVASKLFSE